ncbi:hypothetical protein SDC9_150318 [bioreactor metagenome]|uniref:Uncharacterized protein n=1 Tax=bioreactor metagenome TaxID=1076179 RepID=A0A645EM53_9ZZZZ
MVSPLNSSKVFITLNLKAITFGIDDRNVEISITNVKLATKAIRLIIDEFFFFSCKLLLNLSIALLKS